MLLCHVWRLWEGHSIWPDLINKKARNTKMLQRDCSDESFINTEQHVVLHTGCVRAAQHAVFLFHQSLIKHRAAYLG